MSGLAPMQILSGIQPSGTLHLGNYYGAIQPHVLLQEKAGSKERAFYFIANLHSLTSLHDAARLRRFTRDVAVDYLTLGLDPEKATLFRQSDVPEVCELTWLLSCCVGKGLVMATNPVRPRSELRKHHERSPSVPGRSRRRSAPEAGCAGGGERAAAPAAHCG